MRALHAIAVGALILLSHVAATAAETSPPPPITEVEHLSSARADITVDDFGAMIFSCAAQVRISAFQSPGTLSYHAVGTAHQRYAFRHCLAGYGIPLESKTTISIKGIQQ
jgi:hypothetical protein